MSDFQLAASAESWPIGGSFTISRGTKTEARVVVATVTDGTFTGRGECVPYARYGETVRSVTDQIIGVAGDLQANPDRELLQSIMPAGAARNAVDCALWDLEAKQRDIPAHIIAGLAEMQPQVTAFTLSLDTPEAMFASAQENAHRELLKIKLGGEGDAQRIAAVRKGAPDSRLIVDANEAWTSEKLIENIKICASEAVSLIEQPLPADDDAALADCEHLVPICADESAHTAEGCAKLANRYDAVNIKLDKTGGLTEAQKMLTAAKSANLQIMVGCMVATSLAMAPATIIAQEASFVDLDGPLILAKDRPSGIKFSGSLINPPIAALWG